MAKNTLAAWIQNASPETLAALGLHRKVEGATHAPDRPENSAPVPSTKRMGRAKPRQLEHKDQVRLFQKLGELALSDEYADLGKAFAIPNGGKRHKIVAIKLAAEGVKAGTPDICLPVMRGGYGAMWIELKAEGNKPTEAQKVRLSQLRNDGYYAIVCKGWESALDEMMAYVSGERKRVNVE